MHEKKEISIAESLFKRIIELKPYNIVYLKFVSRFYLNQENHSMAYNYILNAIKMDSSESELYGMLSEYYCANQDSVKEYECLLKEVENQKEGLFCLVKEIYPHSLI